MIMKLSEKMCGISTNVNVLRFIAAVFVIFSHSFYVATANEDPLSVFCNEQTGFGGVAVAIFFFLSGLYVTKSLYRKNDIKEYFKKRFVRIFPQLWVVVLLSVFVLGPILTKNTLAEYFSNKDTYVHLLNGLLIPIHNLPGVFGNNIYDATVNGSLWTLPVEFAAYCGLAFILIISKYLLKNEKHQKLLHLIATIILFGLFILLDAFVKSSFLITVLRPMIIFFMGALYCDYSNKIVLNVPVAITMLFILVIACKTSFLNYALIICLPYILATLVLGTPQTKFNGKILAISYEMYLFGWPIQQIITHVFGGQMNPYLNWIITMPIVIVLAYILYIAIEKLEKRTKKQQ